MVIQIVDLSKKRREQSTQFQHKYVFAMTQDFMSEMRYQLQSASLLHSSAYNWLKENNYV